ncbi:MAG: hypothetical protein P4M13_00125 [Alphaproteobacteria bacterium]|nr:hypothetical protein [Alphaproteobacteria bacterium]
MPAAGKRRLPANDQPLHSLQTVSCVMLPRAFWSRQKIAGAAALAICAVILGLKMFSALPSRGQTLLAQAKPAAVSPPEQDKPYDIVLNASDLAPPDNGLAQIAAKIPADALKPQSSKSQPVLEVKVEQSAPEPDDEDQAEQQANAAQKFMRQGNIKQALNSQLHAVEGDPSDMLYRLDLAILYDKAGESRGAVALYRQVAQAYDEKDDTLPPDLGIDGIRKRLDYLAAKDRQ